jgi:hypothetical protein
MNVLCVLTILPGSTLAIRISSDRENCLFCTKHFVSQDMKTDSFQAGDADRATAVEFGQEEDARPELAEHINVRIGSFLKQFVLSDVPCLVISCVGATIPLFNLRSYRRAFDLSIRFRNYGLSQSSF